MAEAVDKAFSTNGSRAACYTKLLKATFYRLDCIPSKDSLPVCYRWRVFCVKKEFFSRSSLNEKNRRDSHKIILKAAIAFTDKIDDNRIYSRIAKQMEEGGLYITGLRSTAG